MNGKDKILSRIMSDCDESVKAIEADAEKQRGEILAKAKLEADKVSAEIMAKAERKKTQLTASSKSRAELEIRNALLKKRREEIDKTVDMILNYLTGLDDNGYFEFIYKIASTLSGMSGTVYLNEKDLARLPDDFSGRLAASGLNADVSREPADITGGFILKCGDVEENMDFFAIISAKRDELEDYINRELFAE